MIYSYASLATVGATDNPAWQQCFVRQQNEHWDRILDTDVMSDEDQFLPGSVLDTAPGKQARAFNPIPHHPLQHKNKWLKKIFYKKY